MNVDTESKKVGVYTGLVERDTDTFEIRGQALYMFAYLAALTTLLTT